MVVTDERHAREAHDGDAVVKAGRAVEQATVRSRSSASLSRVLGAVEIAAQAERQQRLARQRQHAKERSP